MKIFLKTFLAIFLLLISSYVSAETIDIIVTVDTTKLIAAKPIPLVEEGQSIIPLYDTDREWIEALAVEYFRDIELNYRKNNAGRVAIGTEKVDNTVAVIKK